MYLKDGRSTKFSSCTLTCKFSIRQSYLLSGSMAMQLTDLLNLIQLLNLERLTGYLNLGTSHETAVKHIFKNIGNARARIASRTPYVLKFSTAVPKFS
eukprot:SAG31_NODE_452_length_15484_cov_20.883198_7_plen_98_part_00